MSRRTTTTTTAAPPPAAAAPAAAAACSATESSATRGKPPQSLTEDEIDERLWQGAATQGCTDRPSRQRSFLFSDFSNFLADLLLGFAFSDSSRYAFAWARLPPASSAFPPGCRAPPPTKYIFSAYHQ